MPTKFIVKTILDLCIFTVLLAGCVSPLGLTTDPNLGQIAESNINHITQVCTEKVDGFISGSEHILQIGASAAWSFCDYKDSEGINRRMVVSNQEIGKDENVILLPMMQTVDGKSAGYKDADGNDHTIWAESSDGTQTIVFDFNENQYVLNNDEKQQLSDFVAHLTNVTENVSAAGLESLPTVRPTATETVMPTETVVPTEVPGAMTVENIQNFKDIEKCPIVESPFEDYDKFMGQWRKYLNIVHEQILPDWQKSVITFNGDGSMGINSRELVILPPNTIDYIGGVCFDYNGEKARIVSFVAQKNNDKAIISVMLNPELKNLNNTKLEPNDFLALDSADTSNLVQITFNHSKPDIRADLLYTPFSNLYWSLQKEVSQNWTESSENIWSFGAGKNIYNEEIFLLGGGIGHKMQ